MFAQLIQGRVHDPAGVRRLAERWVTELAPGATGWLGSTAGVTDDGELFTIVRFASPEDARRNSARPEQGVWWEEMAKYFDEPPRFTDCTDVEALHGGGSDDAGFVQVIQARITDRERLDSALEFERTMRPADMGRPDLLGMIVAFHPGGSELTEVAYFTSEAEARRGEAAPRSPELQASFDAYDAATDDVRYLDLRNPWFTSPGG